MMRFGSVLKNQSEIRSDPAVFTKGHPNKSKNIRFFAVFVFFGSVFIWIGLDLSTLS
jgi:hypothetical protein